MKDENFLKENNARILWHPMGHPGDAQVNAPKIIKGADGTHITDIEGTAWWMRLAGCGVSIWAIPTM